MSYLLIVNPSKLLASLIADVVGVNADSVICVSDVPAALTAIVRAKPVAILSALELRGFNGGALVAALKSDACYRSIPVALITSELELAMQLPIAADCVVSKDSAGLVQLRRFLDSVGVQCRVAPSSVTAPRQKPLSGRILLAEDAQSIQKLVRQILHVAGADVVAVDNGEQALAIAEGGTFDLILMDIEMPVMDGWEATARLRERGVGAPIVAFSANSSSEFRQKALERGFCEVLPKPVPRAVLLEICQRYAGGAVMADEKRQHPPKPLETRCVSKAPTSPLQAESPSTPLPSPV